MLNEPDVSYHGVVYTEALGPAAYIGRARVVPLRNMGSAISPFNSFLILQGIETLPVRMDRHCENADGRRQLSEGPSQGEWVRYAGLPDSPDYPLVQQYMDGGKASSILSFGIKAAGREAGARFIDACSSRCGWSTSAMPRPWPAIRPPPPTASSPEELASAGVSEDLVRLSIGIEHIDDIIADLDQADEDQYPWLGDEKRLIRAAIDGGRSLVGVCLGAQLIAEALGAQVSRNPHKEIGWFPIRLTDLARRSPVCKDLPVELQVLHWHGDTFSLPSGALHLAESEACAQQGFLLDGRILGLQFHLEMTPTSLRTLCSQCAEELTPGPFVQSAEQMLAVSPVRYEETARVLEVLLDRLA
jgi:GMP synthase-like glutamine amidotransferase